MPLAGLAAALTASCIAAAPGAAQAQAVVMARSYGNFDVLKDTGSQACGFEMEVHVVSKSQLKDRIFKRPFFFPMAPRARWSMAPDACESALRACARSCASGGVLAYASANTASKAGQPCPKLGPWPSSPKA